MRKYENKVLVNGHEMNVFCTGTGEKAIVFLAGAGVTSPVLEYKPLWEKLADRYRIAVVEKAGYGYSQGNTGASRDIRTMVEESREALAKAGVALPYCLAPHSYSGLEAIWWASQYPQEIAGILGIDMVTPPLALMQSKVYTAEKKAKMMEKQQRLLRPAQKSKFLQRIYKKLFCSSVLVLKSNCLNDEEREEYGRLYFANVCNTELRDEQAMSTENAQLAAQADLHGVAGIMFISDMNMRMKETTWKGENTAYAQKQGWQVYDAPSHQLYAEQAEEIAKRVNW